MRSRLPHFIIFSLLSLSSVSALGSERHALLIGNNNYSTSPLTNPVNDANDLGRKLRQLGYKVTVVNNADHQTMERNINRFAQVLGRNKDNVGVFYFSGHGAQIQGRNYLIPVGALQSIQSQSQVKHRTISSQFIMDTIDDAGNELNVIMLDACRNNPFKGFNKSISAGLAPSRSPDGTVVAYATAPGTTAANGAGRNSPYVESLLKNISVPGQDIEKTLKKVGREVRALTNGKQKPWYEASIVGDFAFARGRSQPAAKVPDGRARNTVTNRRRTPTPPPSVSTTQGYNALIRKAQHVRRENKSSYCQDYANTARRQAQQDLNYKCGFVRVNKNRWSTAFDPQYQWCMKVETVRSRNEAISREKSLIKCR